MEDDNVFESKNLRLKKYAWCMLVMHNPEYLMGALVCAKSLKENNTQYPVVLMITEDINEQCTFLENCDSIFDEIVIVPTIDHPVAEFKAIRQKEMYGGWINKSFTKWNCLTLSYKIEDGESILYDKVMMLDVDMIFVSNCDELFELNTPAGCFSQPWAYPYQKHGALYNPYIRINKRWTLNKDIPHGAIIKSNIIMDTLFTNKGPTFVAGAFMILLEPNIDDYNLLLSIIRADPIYGHNLSFKGLRTNINSISGADETSISFLYAHRGIDFVHIHQKFAAAVWKKEWVADGEERAIHYFGKTKPWNMHVDEYPDLKSWWNIVDILCASSPEFKKLFYPDYDISNFDIAVAEYELAKDIQKIIVAFFTPNNGAKIDKSLLWENAKKLVRELISFSGFLPQFEFYFVESTQLQLKQLQLKQLQLKQLQLKIYPLWSTILETTYNYENFKFLKISPSLFNKLITDIKFIVSKRIQINPRIAKLEILENEIACGSHIKISKSAKYNNIGIEKNIKAMLIADMYENI